MKIVQIEVRNLIPHPGNKRPLDKESIAKLAQDFADPMIGHLEPIIVRPHPTSKDKYQILAGHRRHAAAQAAKFVTMAAIVKDVNDEQAMTILINDNANSDALTPIELCDQCVYMHLQGKQSVNEIATRLHRTPQEVAKLMKLRTLIDSWQRVSDRIPLTVLLRLARLDPVTQKEAYDRYDLRIDEQYLKDIEGSLANAFPWPTGIEYAGCPPCINCPQRTDSQALLWNDVKGARCLNAKCYAKKNNLYAREKVDALLSQHNDITVIDYNRWDHDDAAFVESVPALQKLKTIQGMYPTENGPIRGIKIGTHYRQGTKHIEVSVARYKVNESSTRTEKKKDLTPKEIEGKRVDRYEGLIAKEVLTKLQKQVTTHVVTRKGAGSKPLADFMAFMCLHGVAHKPNVSRTFPPRVTEDEAWLHAWKSIMESLAMDIHFRTGEEALDCMKFSKELATYFGIDLEALSKEVRHANPPPKCLGEYKPKNIIPG